MVPGGLVTRGLGAIILVLIASTIWTCLVAGLVVVLAQPLGWPGSLFSTAVGLVVFMLLWLRPPLLRHETEAAPNDFVAALTNPTLRNAAILFAASLSMAGFLASQHRNEGPLAAKERK